MVKCQQIVGEQFVAKRPFPPIVYCASFCEILSQRPESLVFLAKKLNFETDYDLLDMEWRQLLLIDSNQKAILEILPVDEFWRQISLIKSELDESTFPRVSS